MENEFMELREWKKDEYDNFVLGGDVSATNTSLSVVGIKGNLVDPLFMMRFKSKELSGISEALNTVLKHAHDEYDIQIADACLSPAGPINAERSYCDLTNVPWDIDVNKVLEETMLESIALVNDFEAIGYGIAFLNPHDKNDLIELKHPDSHPKPVPDAVKGIVGAGTGLGKAILFFDKSKKLYAPSPSEGGHEDFPVTDSVEYELSQYAKDKRGGEEPCDYEELLSGKGLVTIYDFILEMEMLDRNEWTEEIEKADDRAAAISLHAKECPICKKSFEFFIRFYARALRNTALNIMARGGMYIAGGIAAKNLDFFTDGELMKEFEANYAYRKLLKEMPVFIITNYNVSLFGCGNVAANFPELALKK